ncbi:SagB/ThcOx family dehydrogenase [Candidatus Aminicenantes bacterium AH-873-B07]|nr:SagB/ThcOx family dehydrogenase [Candidatus Aminicenantes bacterium AH-873-B07]
MSVEEVLLKRRSIRNYKSESLNLEEVSQLLWSAQGETTQWGERTVPSAGATYPLEIYLIVGNVQGIDPGLYHYNPSNHSLILMREGDLRRELTRAALGQDMIAYAPITIVICAEFRRTMRRYGERGIRYVLMEVGHAGQNIHLQAEALDLGTVVIGAFYDEDVKEILGVKEDPLYLMPVGKKV